MCNFIVWELSHITRSCTVSEYSIVWTFRVNKVEGGYSPVDSSHIRSKGGHVEYSTVKWNSTLQLARQAKCIWHNIEVLSSNDCCSGQAIRITHSEYVSIALVIQHATVKAVLYCHLWPIWLCRIFQHCLITGMAFWKKVIEHKMRVLIISTNFIWNYSDSQKNWVRYLS